MRKSSLRSQERFSPEGDARSEGAHSFAVRRTCALARTPERRGRASVHERSSCRTCGEAAGASERPARFARRVLAVYSARTLGLGRFRRPRIVIDFWNLFFRFLLLIWPPKAARDTLAGHGGPARVILKSLREIWRSLWEISREGMFSERASPSQECKAIYLLCILPLATKSRQRADAKEVNHFIFCDLPRLGSPSGA